MKKTDIAAIAATLAATLGTLSLAAPAFAATSHEVRAHHAVYRTSESANDPAIDPAYDWAPRLAAPLGCDIEASFRGEPYCFGSGEQTVMRVGPTASNGNGPRERGWAY